MVIILLNILALAVNPGGAHAMSQKPPAAAAVPTPAPATSADSESIWVGKSDGAQSCGKERGIGLDNMATDLQNKNIKVLARKKVSDGKMRIQMCGADKGDLNGFLISKKDYDKATELGFKQIPGGY